MLESEYQGFSYRSLEAMGSEIAQTEFNTNKLQLQNKKFNKYYFILEAAIHLLRRIAIDPESVSGPEIDEQQKYSCGVARKLDRYIDGQHFWLSGLLAAITGTIDYIKTKDPLHMIHVFNATQYADDDQEDADTPEQHKYYFMLAPKYKTQIALLWKLKTQLGI